MPCGGTISVDTGLTRSASPPKTILIVGCDGGGGGGGGRAPDSFFLTAGITAVADDDACMGAAAAFAADVDWVCTPSLGRRSGGVGRGMFLKKKWSRACNPSAGFFF